MTKKAIKKAPKKIPIKYIDEEERELIEFIESEEWVPSPNQEKHKREAMEAARNYLRKDARINIRLSNADLSTLKYRAAKQGLPYQTLIASVLHQYVTGQLKQT